MINGASSAASAIVFAVVATDRGDESNHGEWVSADASASPRSTAPGTSA